MGVDGWAFRRNHRYGTITCELERRRIVKLMPDREIATVAAWLAAHPGIRVVSRDRGGGYGEAAVRALPEAIQVADRWHLMRNASGTFLEAVSKSMKPIRAALGATVVDPKLLTCAERLQYEGYLRREETNAIVAELKANGTLIKEIVRRTGRSRKLVRLIVRSQRTDIFRARLGSLDPHLPFLDAQCEAGCRNGAELRRLGRTVTDDAQATLGQLVGKRGRELGIPAPLDEAVAKLWGYASERGRHLRDEREPTFDEAELVVTVSAALCTYLSRKAT